MASALALMREFERPGAGAKINALSKTSADTDSINRFPDSGVAMNVARRTIDSLPIFSAGVSFYADFRDLIRGPYFPPTADRVKR